ncbi:UNVERIFIED_CONTAM: hypothetical protein HDU68_008490 [Siphonaria sp. JEL0065]|nr:hypothetical protein HDU68_008490 [Siphonaria sp. JEL0065]
MIQHDQYHCPGLHGPDSTMEIHPKTMAQLLGEWQTLEIPIVQRRYCWTHSEVETWWQCVAGLNGLRNNRGVKAGEIRTGKAVFRERDENTLLVIDGQQRITTTLLLCIALRNEAVARRQEVTVVAINNVLFNATTTSRESSRIIPSYLDRDAYFALLETKIPPSSPSALVEAFAIFAAKAKTLNPSSIHETFTNAIHKMYIMSILITTRDLQLCQVFQWLQEKSLLAETILFNPTPGRNFGTLDIVRNLLLSNFMDCERDELEKVYETAWLPFEMWFPRGSGDFDDFLVGFLGTVGCEGVATVSRQKGVVGKPMPTVAQPGFDIREKPAVNLSGLDLYKAFVIAYTQKR